MRVELAKGWYIVCEEPHVSRTSVMRVRVPNGCLVRHERYNNCNYKVELLDHSMVYLPDIDPDTLLAPK